MNSLTLPSKNLPSPEDMARFERLTTNLRARLKPMSLEESALCDQLIIATWHLKAFKMQAAALRRQVSALSAANPEDPALPALREQYNLAERQVRRQKNFSWRRRRQYWSLHFENRPGRGKKTPTEISCYHRPEEFDDFEQAA